MFIIEKGKAYIIKGDKAIQIAFNKNDLKYVETDKEIEYSNQSKYSLNEVIAKLNVRNNIRKAKAKEATVVNDSELLKEVERLNEENNALKDELAKKDKEISELLEQIEASKEDEESAKDDENKPEVENPENQDK